MLELAAAAVRESDGTAAPGVGPGSTRRRRQHVARRREGDMPPARGDAVAARGDADDRRRSQVGERAGCAATRSSAIIAGPAISAARPCSQTAAQAASNAGMPARPQRRDHPGQHVARAGARQPGRRRRREAEPAVGRGDQRVRPLVDDHRAAIAAAAASARSALLPASSPNSLREFALVRREDRVMAVAAARARRPGRSRRRRSPPGASRSAPASAPAGCRPGPARPGSRRCAGR